jgi:phosphohistidine phosphatase SixA
MADERTDFERSLAEVPEEQTSMMVESANAARDHERLCSAYLRTFTSLDGELVLRHLRNNFFECTSLFPDADPHKTLIAEGKRFVVITILALMEEGRTQHGRG